MSSISPKESCNLYNSAGKPNKQTNKHVCRKSGIRKMGLMTIPPVAVDE